ncbi:L-dopachrome tautomerase-related protein [Paracoccus homiensis]|uniref:Major royal jelly protein n=1 Tax=Paracoccus homiensis TaxID=364199 RepID=A0A1I0IMF4_9RHOB|nr:L-dopachrome tautomerase-related protein [Paracoccus homiensis]SET97551.1 Major royal jelly protein [Paracoccus homiensis]
MRHKLTKSIGAALFLAPPLWAAEPEVIAEWVSLPYIVVDTATKSTWENSELFGKALVQGAKVDSQGNFYVSTARWGGKEIPATLSKLVKTGDGWALEAYPSEAMNDIANAAGLKAVLGFEIDRNDVMWIFDQGHVAGEPNANGDAKLVLWDIKANQEVQRYNFTAEDPDPQCSFLNVVVVDNDSGFAYIADSGIFCDPLHGGLITYDMNTNSVRRLLDQHRFTNDEPNFFFNIGDRPILKNGRMRTGADGIALSADKRTLYWTNLTGNHLYSLPTRILRDFGTNETVIEGAVEVAAVLPTNTDGMTADSAGNIYMTALSLDGIMKFDPSTRRVSRFAYHPDMNWPDTLAWGPDGEMYVVSNNLHLWVDGDMTFDDSQSPNFRIWKIPDVGQSYTTQ